MTIAGPAADNAEEATLNPEGPLVLNKKIKTGEGRLALYLVAPTLILLILVVGYPIIKAIYSSFLSDGGLNKVTGTFGSGGDWVGLTHYKEWLLQKVGNASAPAGTLQASFWSSIVTTLLFAVATVVLETIIGMGFALIMNREFTGRAIVRACILIPWAIPTAVTTKMWQVIFDPSGILNKLLGTHYLWTSQEGPERAAIIMADTWKTTPFIALLILAGLQGISADIYESARMDGANAWQRFTKITLPLVRPALAVAVIFRSLDALRMYDLPYIFSGGANGTTTVSILVVQQIKTTNLNSASALSTISFIFIFGIALLLVRLFNANIGGQTKELK